MPKVGFSRCIDDWPTSGGTRPIKTSLAADAPKLLWTLELDGSQASSKIESSDGGPVLSGNRLALQAGRFVYFVDKDGSKAQAASLTAVNSYPSGLVADPEGNVYFVGQSGVFSVNTSGKMRWQGGDAGQTQGEFTYYDPPVLGPDGVLYAVTSNQRVFAIRTSDGSTIWSQAAPNDQCCRSRVMGGGGAGLFLAVGSTRTDALDTKDGTRLGTFVNPGYGGFTWLWGNWVLGWNLGIADGRYLVFDTCGNLRMPRGGSGATGVVGPGELLVVGTSYQAGEILLVDTDGGIVAGPVPAEGQPLAAGADGTLYTVRCQEGLPGGDPSINRIVAYSADLVELWRFDLGGDHCIGLNGNVVLDDDGVIYLKRTSPTSTGTQVMAIQTQSPGLADSSWPSWRHDNRGTAWLVPGIATSADRDGGGIVDPVDAPGSGSD